MHVVFVSWETMFLLYALIPAAGAAFSFLVYPDKVRLRLPHTTA